MQQGRRVFKDVCPLVSNLILSHIEKNDLKLAIEEMSVLNNKSFGKYAVSSKNRLGSVTLSLFL